MLKRKLRMKCSGCGCWNSFRVNKIFLEQSTSEPKVKAYIPFYEPLKTAKCKKCGKVIAEPKTLIRITSKESTNRTDANRGENQNRKQSQNLD